MIQWLQTVSTWRRLSNMQERTINRFSSITELQSALKKELEILQKKTDEYSQLIGEKLRNTQTEDPKEIEEFKTMLDGPQDAKKKPIKKKESKQWREVQSVMIYDGIGLKGELEIYFKSLDELKLKLDKIKKISESVDDLVAKGFRKDLGIIATMSGDLSFSIVFLKSAPRRAKFAYKTIFDVEAENQIAV